MRFRVTWNPTAFFLSFRDAAKGVILKREALTFQCASTVKVNLLKDTAMAAEALVEILVFIKLPE